MPYRPPLYGMFLGHIFFCKYGGWGWSELFSVCIHHWCCQSPQFGVSRKGSPRSVPMFRFSRFLPICSDLRFLLSETPEKRSETCPKNVNPLSGHLKIFHRHFSNSFSPPKFCTTKTFFFLFVARICRGGHTKRCESNFVCLTEVLWWMRLSLSIWKNLL